MTDKKPGVSLNGHDADMDSLSLDQSGLLKLGRNVELYKTEPRRWYQALPYTFEFTNRKGLFLRLNLPINPSNLTISTHFATNIIPTLYGTVEEHSEQRYFDIMIEGTTGMAPKYIGYVRSEEEIEPVNSKKPDNDRGSKGRGSNSVAAGKNSIGGFFQGALGTVNQTLDNVNSALNLGTERETGLYVDQTGYVAFHELYKMFLNYKKETSGEKESGTPDKREHHPLIFKNYKDNNQYYVVPTVFQMVRSADSPMLYRYQIGLRAYNLQQLQDKLNFDELAVRYNDLGLNGIKANTFFDQATGVVGAGVAVIGGLGAAAGILGL